MNGNCHPVRDYLRRNRITQRQVAQDLDYAESYFSEVLSGRRRASPDFRRRVAEYLGVGEDHLFASDEAQWKARLRAALADAPPTAQQRAARALDILEAAEA